METNSGAAASVCEFGCCEWDEDGAVTRYSPHPPEYARLLAEQPALYALYDAVERADNHGNLYGDVEEAFARCEARLKELRA